MSEIYEHKSNCTCVMCGKIEEIRNSGNRDFSCKDGCSCENCTTVRRLGDAREQGKRDAEELKAYEAGFKRAR